MHSGKKKLFGRPPCVIAEVSTVSNGSWDGFVLFVFFRLLFSSDPFAFLQHFGTFGDLQGKDNTDHSHPTKETQANTCRGRRRLEQPHLCLPKSVPGSPAPAAAPQQLLLIGHSNLADFFPLLSQAKNQMRTWFQTALN